MLKDAGQRWRGGNCKDGADDGGLVSWGARDTVARDEIGEKEPCAKERELRRIPVNGEG